MMENNIPQHIAIIMDGNRRWAKERGLPVVQGHWEGYNTLKKITQYCFKKGIKVLTVYAFSSENWVRPENEIKAIFEILKFGLSKEIDIFIKEKIRVNFIGRLDKFPSNIVKKLNSVMKITSENSKATLNVAINYGGRAEIIDTLKKIINLDIKSEDLTEKTISDNIYTKSFPDPDIIIRTSGEKRLSGFLLWQSQYSELMFIDKYWPDFLENDLDSVLDEYKQRKRRFGK